MSTTINSAFVNKVLGKMVSDSNGEVVANRNYRKAVAAVKGQISAFESNVVEMEEAVATAEENLENAKYPTGTIGDTGTYLRTLVSANEHLIRLKETLEDTNRSVKFYTDLLAEFNA